MQKREYDLVTFGRSNVDLLSQQVGAAFGEIETFSTQIGGSPANIAVGLSRLGGHAGILTAVGDDPLSELVRARLQHEKVDIRHVLTKAGQTNLTLMGVELPQTFSLMPYQTNAPEQYLGIDDIGQLPYEQIKYLAVAAGNLAFPSLAEATLEAARVAKAAGTVVLLDLEMHPDRWPDVNTYIEQMKKAWPACGMIIGTEPAMWTVLSDEPHLGWEGKLLTSTQREHLETRLEAALQPGQTAVIKRGILGAAAYPEGEPRQLIPGFRVDVFNRMGAGDAFVAGLVYGLLQTWAWPRTLRFANACYAVAAKAYEVSMALPTKEEVDKFIETFGFFEMPPDW